MTLLDERPSTESPTTVPSMVSRVFTAPTSSWRFASRLARREVRRRPGRTLLVMLLVVIPVLGMTAGSILYRTARESDRSASFRQFGTADLLLFSNDRVTGSIDFDASVFDGDAPALPDGSTTTDYVETYTTVSAVVDGVVVTRALQFSDVDLSDPITASTVEISQGRAPNDGGEVLLSPGASERFEAGVGDNIRFVRPDMDVTVVGIGRDADNYSSDLMVVADFDRSLFRSPDFVSVQTLVDLPDGVTDRQYDRLVFDFERAEVSAVDPTEWTYYDEGATNRELAWGWVAGVVALVAVGIVIAAAFATSARRQLVTIGQLAANGAPERLIRRTMGLQGLWTGLLGAVLGVVVATAGLVIVHGTALAGSFANHAVPSLSIVPLDLLVIVLTATAAATVSALIPARSASRIPVLSALAGRRPVSTPPRWMAPIGSASFLVGIFLLGGAASIDAGSTDFPAMLAVIGSLCVLAGIVCASPLIVAAVGSVGSRAGGVIRLAARSLGRSRSRSAAVLTAIATVGALAMVAATVAPTVNDQSWEPDLRTVTLRFEGNLYGPGNDETIAIERSGVYDPGPVVPTELPVDIRQGIERALPDATVTPITRTVEDPLPFRVDTGETIFPPGYSNNGVPIVGNLAVGDPSLRGLLGLDAEQERILADDGVLGLTPYLDRIAVSTPSGPVDVDLRASVEALGFAGVPDTQEEYDRANEVLDGRSGNPFEEIVVTPRFVEENGLLTAISSYTIENPVDLTGAQRDAISELQPFWQGQDAFVASATAAGFETLGAVAGDDGSYWYPSYDSPPWRTPAPLIQLAVIVASLLLVLGVVAIGLSLAATESRDERDVLHAVGASPKTLRRVSAAKAWVLTTGAAVVAVPVGYVTIFVITRATDARAPFPFIVAGALLVGIPLIAAGSTMAVSALAQRLRPVTYSTLAAD